MQELKEMRSDISFLKTEVFCLNEKFSILDAKVTSLDAKVTSLEDGQHRTGLLVEDTNNKVDLILELLHAMSSRKVDRSEFEFKFEQHEVRIQSLEATARSKSSRSK